ncbi:MAG: glutathione peroxidase [Burkholderiales bacterium]|nr:glutathione peroxidase [Burkholderiales bacterium]MDE2564380.1 glutathione peroxidase [Burkholderiales bacterium]
MKRVSLSFAFLAAAAAVLTLGAAPAAQAAQGAPATQATAPAAAAACPALLDFTVPRLQDDSPQSLCQYAGKVVLVVNTASYCGFTPQYKGLEAMYAKYGPRGLVVLGFPSNDFGQQEPGDRKQIADFCFNTYGVKFPMFGKTEVVGPHTAPLFVALAQATGQRPSWNFHKYLIGRDGRAIAGYASEVTPDDPKLLATVEQALAAR